MSITKIKGHRIDEGSIELKHLKSDFKLPESKMNLNHPTHDNSGDITLAQKIVLTNGGNADLLHYHTGGGGGPQGIYTNEQRDAQLLKLSMLLSSTVYGMEKSFKELFDNDNDVYYGLPTSVPPILTNILDDPNVNGTLLPNQVYTYGISYKNINGETNVLYKEHIQTGNGTVNAIKVKLTNVPKNIGIKMFRTDEDVEQIVTQNEDQNEWNNNQRANAFITRVDKTDGLSSLAISIDNVSGSNPPTYAANNIAYSIGKTVLSIGKALSTVVYDETPEYFIQINNKGKTERIDLVWDINPANVPIDYELYYTTTPVAYNARTMEWQKFDSLSKLTDYKGVVLPISTNGTITDNCKIASNNESQNVFKFTPVQDITAIYVKVTKQVSHCNLNDVRLWTVDGLANKVIYKTFYTPQDFSNYNTLKFDMKSNVAHGQGYRLAFLKNTETVGSITTDCTTSYNSYTNLTGKIVRSRIPFNNDNQINKSAFDRVRITIKPQLNQYLKFENAYLTLDNTVHSHIPSYVMDGSLDTYSIPITFNGSNSYEGTPTGDIISDWIPITLPTLVTAAIISIKIINGSLAMFTNSYTGYSLFDAGVYSGLENIPKISQYVVNPSPSINYDLGYIYQIQTGKSNTYYVLPTDFDYFKPNVLDQWHKHYIPITPAALTDIRNFAVYLDNPTVDTDVLLDNVTLTRAKNILTTTGITTTYTGSQNSNAPVYVSQNNANSFTSDVPPIVSAPKNIMFAFSTAVTVSKLLMMFGLLNNRGKNYTIQYSNAPTVTVNDAYDSGLWTNVSKLTIGDSNIPSTFTGTISDDNIIYDNNVWETHICHNFDPVTCTKLRIVVFATGNDSVLNIMNVKIMSANDLGVLKLINETFEPAKENDEIIDTGFITQNIDPVSYNTTGSSNIYYDTKLDLINIIDPTKDGILILKTLTIELYSRIILTAQVLGTVQFNVSNDNGVTYIPVTLDKLTEFTEQSTTITIKAILKSADAVINAIAFLYAL